LPLPFCPVNKYTMGITPLLCIFYSVYDIIYYTTTFAKEQ